MRAACVACGKVALDGVMVDGSRWSECGEEARVWCWRIIDQGLRGSLDNQIGRSNSRGSKANAPFTHEGEIGIRVNCCGQNESPITHKKNNRDLYGSANDAYVHGEKSIIY